MSAWAIGSLLGCVQVPATTAVDPGVPAETIAGYRFHLQRWGSPASPPLILVHGGPGGDCRYLRPLQALSDDYRVICYDQRGSGLSPRVAPEQLTLEQNLADLDAIVDHHARGGPVRLLGHSWGAMLVIAYLGRHPGKVSHAVAVEPGMLDAASAAAFVEAFRAGQSWRDALPMLGYIAESLRVTTRDGHERFDHVMTRMLNRSKPGGLYQCPGEALPPDAFARGGYQAFARMLKPVLSDPAAFHHDLTAGVHRHRGVLVLVGSSCSFIGHAFQARHHLPRLPAHTRLVKAEGMGHNMLTLNLPWSLGMLRSQLAAAP